MIMIDWEVIQQFSIVTIVLRDKGQTSLKYMGNLQSAI